MLNDLTNLFPHSAPIDTTAATVETRMAWADVPAKCAVYLLASGEAGVEPLLLATVGNLRAALQRRLSDVPPDHTKRIPYAQLCTRVHWRIVHSPFAANWWYWRTARTLFPDRYKELLGWGSPWWIATERVGDFPRLRRTQDLGDGEMDYAGPIRDRASAGKLIDTVEDLFDLCRYHHILVQAPQGKACAYKEMGKCLAPCDGSVPVGTYLPQMRKAFDFVIDREDARQQWLNEQQAAMRGAAAKLAFEQAGKVKQRLERAAAMRMEAATFVAPLQDFAFLMLQPGPGRTTIEPWLAVGGRVEALPIFKKKDYAATVGGLWETVQDRASMKVEPPLDREAAEQVDLVAHHLFRLPRDPGLYLRFRELLTGGPGVLQQLIEHWLCADTETSALPELASDSVPVVAEPPTEAGVKAE